MQREQQSYQMKRLFQFVYVQCIQAQAKPSSNEKKDKTANANQRFITIYMLLDYLFIERWRKMGVIKSYMTQLVVIS